VGEDKLVKQKCARIDTSAKMPSQNFTTHTNDRGVLDSSLSQLSFEEIRHASLSNMELPPEIRKIVDGILLERSKKALLNRMDITVARIAINHIGEALDVVSLLVDLLTVLPENIDLLYKEDKQQLLRLRGILRRQLIKMEEIAYLEPEIYEEHIRNQGIHIIKAREDSIARFRSQVKYFIGSLDLISVKNVEELMEQRRRLF